MDFITETQYRQEISDLWTMANQHKAQLAERDQVIVEQQAQIDTLLKELIVSHGGTLIRMVTVPGSLSALEAALKAERIKTLEDRADNIHARIMINAFNPEHTVLQAMMEVESTLRRIANELKK